MQPMVDEVSVRKSIRRACSASRKGVMSMVCVIHLSSVEAICVPAVPTAIPSIEPMDAMVMVWASISVMVRRFLAPMALSVVSS